VNQVSTTFKSDCLFRLVVGRTELFRKSDPFGLGPLLQILARLILFAEFGLHTAKRAPLFESD
jgi:hypothetical protein